MTTEKKTTTKSGEVNKAKPAKRFTMHKLMMNAGIPSGERNRLGIEMANAYRAVMGKSPAKTVIDPTPKKNGQPSFQLSVYPIDWLPIAQNIIDQHLKKKADGKV